MVDVQGKPVAGAFVFAQTWRRYHSLDLREQTDPEGRFAWRSAPPDAVLYDIGKAGFMPRRALPLIASEREQVVTLHPPLVITGRVTDAETGQRLPKCVIIEGVGFAGSDQISWSRGSVDRCAGGEYTASFDEPNDAMYVRVEALGYKPAESRAFRPGDGRQTFDVALERAETLSGIVLLPGGKPANGVDVVLATEADQVLFQAGRLESRTSAPRSRTGADGRFAFTAPKGNFLLIALGDAGYADVSPAAFAKSDKLTLQPWGRLEGQLIAGRRPKANEEISFSPGRPHGGLPQRVFTYQYDTRTNDDGRFAFDRVIPGQGLVTRAIVTDYGRFSQHWVCGGEAVDILPGRTTAVRIGGNGRPVIGRVVPEGTPETPIEWAHNPPVKMTRPKHEGDKTPSPYVILGSNFDKDGRFRIDDVTPGTYDLAFSINAKPNPEVFEPGEAFGSVRMSVTVPEIPGGRSDEPLDLGTITAKLFERLKVGDLAPDFTVPRIAGKGKGDQLRLADYRGNLVLVDFWATWCGPCLAEMPALKDIQKTFGADPRFNLISLACDKDDEGARRYIRENGLIWTHGFAGDLAMGVGLRYKVRSIPATFLIGPDGRILAKNLQGPALKEAIVKALTDGKLFATPKRAAHPERFPVTRFEVPVEKAVETPLAVVLDDCDEDFKAARPHHDTLRILYKTVDGVRTSLLREFNTCQTVGAVHGVAIDAARGRIYLCEQAAHRVTAVDFHGRKLWQVARINADALAVDPRTGNLWCSVGENLVHGETVVLNADGQEVASFPFRGIDIAYDPHTDGFWLVGYGITKLSREGKVLFQKPKEGWAYASVAPNPRDGSVWIVERAHPQVARSMNRLWHLAADGSTIRKWDLDEKLIFGVACEPVSGTAWAVFLGSGILRITADGKELPPLPVKARAISISPTTGQVWVTTETEILRLDGAGQPKTFSRFDARSGQSWPAAL